MKEIKLKSQPKWMVRMFILVGAILGGVFAFISHPIGGTSAQSLDCPDGQHLATGNVCVTNDLDIVIQATATGDGQTLTINKYFANTYTVDWGDGSPVENLTADTTHTYVDEGIYNIIISLTLGASRWTFQNVEKPLITRSGTTMTGVKITYMPSLADGFGDSATEPGDYFFVYFNGNRIGHNDGGVITTLPVGSFDTSSIITAGDYFFYGFNTHQNNENYGFVSLPEGSFDISNITTAGDYFFGIFNYYGSLTSLPEGSFNMENITTVGDYYFSSFNGKGRLTSLPAGSFRLSTGLKAAGNYFFSNFNGQGRLTSLSSGSFNTENITTVGNGFFYDFNYAGRLTGLPSGSFDTSNMITVGNNFFYMFNYAGSLKSLPEGSFNTENITTVGDYYFYSFNGNGGDLTSLPIGSFRLSTGLTTIGTGFFSQFNAAGGGLISLPEGSFNTENVTTVGNAFFEGFTSDGVLTNLPEGSFNIENITTVGNGFFSNFNAHYLKRGYGLINLPEGSFRLSTGLTIVGGTFFSQFNYYGSLTSLPEGSFNTENIKTVGNGFFSNFNYYGSLTSLPDSFKLNPAAYNKPYGYANAFNSSNYTLNKNVSDLVSGVIAPSSDRDTFSDNQPGIKCGVHPYRLVNSENILCTITYDTNGGSTIINPIQQYVSNTTSVVAGSGVATPMKDGYVFDGWYTEPEGGELVENVFFPSMDGDTLYAHWEIGNTVTFDANGGTTSQTTQTIVENTSINLPNAFLGGYEFLGWYTEFDGGERVGGYNDSYLVLGNITLYAHWKQNPTVTFDTNGGVTSQTTQTVVENTSINLPNASRNGFEFIGWYTEEIEGVRVGGYNDSYTVSQDIILYAHWIEALPEGIFFQTGDITYTDTNGKVFTGIGTITIRSGGETITILDRNLGATTNDISDTGSHGYYFQWGNSYGFSLDEDFQISSTAIEATDYTWNNPYVSGNFIATNYRDISYNPELWGGAGDYDNDRGIDTSNDGYTRQGPCPAGYHVPSIGEFDELMRITKSITGGTVQLQTNDNGNLVESNPFAAAFMSELHFPIAGYIGWDGVYTGILEEGYSYSYFWSSSFRKANGYLMINRHPTASKKDKVSTRGNSMQQGNAFSIRCFKDTTDDGEEIVLSYETRDGSAIQAQTLPVGGTGYIPGYSTHREDAELLGWYEEDLLTQIDLENKILDKDTTIYAKWSDDYMVKFLDFDDTILKTEVVRSGDSVIAPVNPVRDGYTFNGWDLDFSNVTGDMVITAQYTKNQSTSNGGGGGGGSSLKRDNCPDGDYSDSYYDGKCGKKPIQKDDERDSSTKPQNGKTGHNSAKNEVVYDTLRFNPYYSDEMNQAYQFAYHYGITTKTNIKDAAMNWELTRIAMAKMLSQYAINVLGIKPDTTRNNDFTDVPDKLDSEYDDGVTLAYQLGIMGINMPNNEFKPYNYVTRAEFATAFSRLLYNTPDGKYEMTSSYYVPHINKLAYEGILTNTDPYMKELRGYVMLMLMRSAK